MTARLPVPTEDQEQERFIAWCDTVAARRWPSLVVNGVFGIYAIPNGGARSKVTGARLKRGGVRAGVLDLFLPEPRAGHCGLYIEMKRVRGGVVSREQDSWINHLQGRGYRVVVARGCNEAIAAVEEYLR